MKQKSLSSFPGGYRDRRRVARCAAYAVPLSRR